MAEKGVHIGNGTAFFMIAIAVFIDAIQAFLTLIFIGIIFNPIIGFMSGILFGIWFSHHNISLVGKHPFRFFGTILLEFLPIVSALPGWSVLVSTTIAKERLLARGII